VQALGVGSVVAFVGLSSAAFFLALKATVGIRVSETEEIEGLDLHEHGAYGYPELAMGTQAFPAGPRGDMAGVTAAATPRAAPVHANALLQE
jgi:Amt family ammonium transporter